MNMLSDKLLALHERLLDRQQVTCRASFRNYTCEDALLGSLVRGLSESCVYPLPLDPQACAHNLKMITKKLSAVEVTTDHKDCSRTADVRDVINSALLRDLPLTGYHSHLQAQAMKSGLAKEGYWARADLSHIASSYDDFYD